MITTDIFKLISERFTTGYYNRCLELCNNNPRVQNSDLIAQRCKICLKQLSDADILYSLDSDDPNSRVIALSKQIAELKKGTGKIPKEHVEMLLQSLNEFTYHNTSQDELLPESLTLLADAYLQLDNHKSALKFCPKNNPQTCAMEIYIHLRMKNYTLALETSKKMSQQHNKSPTFLLASACSYFSNGKWSEGFELISAAERALDTLDPMIVQQPDSICFSTAKAIGYMGKGDWIMALDHLEQVKNDPCNDGNVLANMITCYWNMNDEENAQRLYARLEEMYPNNTLVLNTKFLSKCVEDFEAKYCK